MERDGITGCAFRGLEGSRVGGCKRDAFRGLLNYCNARREIPISMAGIGTTIFRKTRPPWERDEKEGSMRGV